MRPWRVEIYHADKGLAFGGDHACGEFLQVWDLSKGRMPDVDNIIVDEDRLTPGFTHEKMNALIAEHGFTYAELKQAWEDAGRP